MSYAARAKAMTIAQELWTKDRGPHYIAIALDAYAAEQTAGLFKLMKRAEQERDNLYSALEHAGWVVTSGNPEGYVKRLAEQTAALRQRLIDADLLHLADEQTVRNLERREAALRSALTRYRDWIEEQHEADHAPEYKVDGCDVCALLAAPEGQRAAEPSTTLPKQVICTKCGYVATEQGPTAIEWRAFVVLRDAAWIYRKQWMECHEPINEGTKGDLVALGYARGDLFAAVEAARR